MRYIIAISNVSSQGEQCMMIPMVGLVILVLFISNSASNVTTEERYIIYKSRRRWSCEIFIISLSIHGFSELKPCIHASSFGDRSVCFSVKENSEMAQEQEYRFRGSINLTTNDCIVGIVSAYSLVLVIFMLK